MSIKVGDVAPAQSIPLTAYDRTRDSSEDRFRELKLSDYHGKWVCLFFYPQDFTEVCPTEIVAFNTALTEFHDRQTDLLAASTDSVHAHKGWCDAHADLGEVKYLMIGDVNHQLSLAFGVLDEEQGTAKRGIFLVDPQGQLRWAAVYDLNVGRSVDEVLRVLDALQTDKLCPCNWKRGEGTLN